ncbi:glycosyltransferase [Microbacterium sp. P5_E9]
MHSTKLAIAIPTYDRPTESLLNDEDLLREAMHLGVEIYISDDSTDDRTQVLAAGVMTRFSHVHYRRNTPSLGHDANVVETLLWPAADYVWLLGDTFRTLPGELERIVSQLHGQAFQFVNWSSGDLAVTEVVDGDAARALVREKIWHQTLTGATIYHRSVCDWVREVRPATHANFPHLDVILGFAAACNVSVGWYGRKALTSAPKNGSYWHHRALDVFVDDWVAVLSAYPSVVPADQLAKVVRSHSANTGLFSYEFLTTLRSSGHLNWRATRRPLFWDAMHLSRFKVVTLLLTPRRIAADQLRAHQRSGVPGAGAR